MSRDDFVKLACYEFLMERASGLLKEFLDRPEIKHTMDEVVTGDLTSNNDEVIKFIL